MIFAALFAARQRIRLPPRDPSEPWWLSMLQLGGLCLAVWLIPPVIGIVFSLCRNGWPKVPPKEPEPIWREMAARAKLNPEGETPWRALPY